MRSAKLSGYSKQNVFVYMEVAYVSGTSPETVCWEKRLGLRRVAKCGFRTLGDT